MVESTPPVPGGHKMCRTCLVYKPFSEFSRKGNGYRSACKLCRTGESRRWREANPTYFVEYHVRNREKKCAVAREHRRLNPEDPARSLERHRAWRKANADRVATVNCAWRTANADLVRESGLRCQNRRRARLLGLPVEPYTVDELLERDGTCCVLCGEKLDLEAGRWQLKSVTIEHLECISWPDSAGDVPTNVALSHWSCNMRRGTGPHPAAAQKRRELLAQN